jgi:CAAX prenyl protease-like protein
VTDGSSPRVGGRRQVPAWLPYVLPMGCFGVVTAIEGAGPPTLYPAIYLAKIGIVVVAIAIGARHWRAEFKPSWRGAAWGIAAGLLGFVGWVSIDPLTPHFAVLGERAAFDPFTQFHSPTVRSAFIGLRLFGLAVVVPIMEEVFWRSFVLRYLTDPDRWRQLPLHDFTIWAAGLMAAFFALSHPEWLVALLYAVLMAGLLRMTRELFCCTLAHAVTNLSLGLFVLKTGAWAYW